jgi:hypothetical protein
MIMVYLENNSISFDLPFSPQAASYLEEWGIKDDIIMWKKALKSLIEFYKNKTATKEEAILEAWNN